MILSATSVIPLCNLLPGRGAEQIEVEEAQLKA